MKCIKAVKQTNLDEIGKIVRISDKLAEQRVKTGYWMFISKSEWKESGRVNSIQDEPKLKLKKVEKDEKKYRKKTKKR